jgi:hypothetical protein
MSNSFYDFTYELLTRHEAREHGIDYDDPGTLYLPTGRWKRSDTRQDQEACRVVCELTKTMTPQAWNQLTDAQKIPWVEAALKSLRAQNVPDMLAQALDPQEADKGTPPCPKKLLTGWQSITATLEMPYNRRDEIKSLNDRFDGPIINNGRGTKPMTYREELLTWWDTLAQKQQELADQRQGERFSTEGHAYGRTETVVPEIAGSIKKRRKDKHT